MFMGEYKHTIDAKGRLIIPAKIRNECAGAVIVTRGLDGCLSIYTEEGWQSYYEKLQNLPGNKKDVRKAMRLTTSQTGLCEFDKMGRINIPQGLINLASLKKDCVVVGAGDHAEIWSQERWDSYYQASEDDYDDIFESLEDFEV